MTGETDLEILLQSLSAELTEDVFVFATLPDGAMPRGIHPRMMFQETEGTTIVLTRQEATERDITFEFPCRMITLNIHSSLDAVGFIAVIAAELAKHGMGVNPVSAFYHDHLFVPEDRKDDAMKILEGIAEKARLRKGPAMNGG
ncbi:MAG: ACT domain-containing protein [Pseudomonadota bacterium]